MSRNWGDSQHPSQSYPSGRQLRSLRKPDSSAGNSLSRLLAKRLTDEETEAQGEMSVPKAQWSVVQLQLQPWLLAPGPAPFLCVESITVSAVSESQDHVTMFPRESSGPKTGAEDHRHEQRSVQEKS